MVIMLTMGKLKNKYICKGEGNYREKVMSSVRQNAKFGYWLYD